MEFKGKVIAVLPVKSGTSKSSGSPWQVQEYVVESEDQYPKKMCFEVFGEEKIQRFNIQMGEVVTVQFDIDARQWNDRWFNSIRAWRIDREPVAPAPAAPQAPASNPAGEPLPFAVADDDLPF